MAELDARRAMDFLRASELFKTDLPLEGVLSEVSRIEEVAGYVVAWDKYVVVVGADVAFRSGAFPEPPLPRQQA